MNAVRGIAQPVGYDELMGITEVWWIRRWRSATARYGRWTASCMPRERRSALPRREARGRGDRRDQIRGALAPSRASRNRSRVASASCPGPGARSRRPSAAAIPWQVANRQTHQFAADRRELDQAQVARHTLDACACSRTCPQSSRSPAWLSALMQLSASRMHWMIIRVRSRRPCRAPQARPGRWDRTRCRLLLPFHWTRASLPVVDVVERLPAMSASVSSRRTVETGLARNARAPARTQAWIDVG